MKRILLIGNGGHAKSVVDAIERVGEYEIVGFIAEKNDIEFEYRGYRIVGTDAELETFYRQGILHACICIGYLGKGRNRDNLYYKLKEIGYKLPIIIDPSAVVACDVKLGEGSFVGKNVVINAGTVIGRMTIINTAAIVEHDCIIGDFTHIAVNATLCGSVSIGCHCLIGAGATIIQELEIEENVVIGANSTVLANVKGNKTVYNIYVADK